TIPKTLMLKANSETRTLKARIKMAKLTQIRGGHRAKNDSGRAYLLFAIIVADCQFGRPSPALQGRATRRFSAPSAPLGEMVRLLIGDIRQHIGTFRDHGDP